MVVAMVSKIRIFIPLYGRFVPLPKHMGRAHPFLNCNGREDECNKCTQMTQLSLQPIKRQEPSMRSK